MKKTDPVNVQVSTLIGYEAGLRDGAAALRERLESSITWRSGSLAAGDVVINAEARGWNSAMQYFIGQLDAGESRVVEEK